MRARIYVCVFTTVSSRPAPMPTSWRTLTDCVMSEWNVKTERLGGGGGGGEQGERETHIDVERPTMRGTDRRERKSRWKEDRSN